MATEPIKREGRFVHGKLKMWKERIKRNVHGQDVPYDIYFNATAVLKIDSVYKQGKRYHPQVYVEGFIYTDVENEQCNMLSDDDDDDDDDEFFEVQKGKPKDFCNLPGVTNCTINEQDSAVRTCKKVEYTSSILYENKGRA